MDTEPAENERRNKTLMYMQSKAVYSRLLNDEIINKINKK